MKKKLTFLGIETSCDETAAAIIKENDKGTAEVLSNVVSSQIKEHENYGGVVPELAARAHLENIDFVVNKAVYTSGIKLEKIDGMTFNPIIDEWKVSKDKSVNYITKFKKI